MIPNAYIGKYHITLGLAVTLRITSPSVGEWNIVMSLSVCPHACQEPHDVQTSPNSMSTLPMAVA